jgi:hypothetical protein
MLTAVIVLVGKIRTFWIAHASALHHADDF